MLKMTKVALATLLAAFLVFANSGCKYLDSATGESVEVSTQEGAPTAEPSGGIEIPNGNGEQGGGNGSGGSGEQSGGSGSGEQSQNARVTVYLVSNGNAYSMGTLTLAQVKTYSDQGYKAYWDSNLTQKINDFNEIKDGDTIYVTY